MATYSRTYGSGNDYIAPPDGYSVYIVNGGAGTDTLFADARSTGFTFSAPDAAGMTTVSGASGTTLKLTNVEKIAFKDNVVKTLSTTPAPAPAPAVNKVVGTSGNDVLSGTAGNDAVDGGLGTDTYHLTGVASNSVALTRTATGWALNGGAVGSDTIANVERIAFADKKVALDVAAGGNAAEALQFIGTLASGLKGSASVVGTVLALADQTDLRGLFQTAQNLGLVAQLAGGSSNTDVAKLAYRNIIGAEANAPTASQLAAYMDGGMSQVDFLTTVAAYVSLVGVQATGLDYL